MKQKDHYQRDGNFSLKRKPYQYTKDMTTKDGQQKVYNIENNEDADMTLKQMPKEEQFRDNVKQYIQDGVDYDREISQGQEDEDRNIETQIELDATLQMLEQDMTLEDVIKKLEQQSNDLEMKIGPNLTRMLLEGVGKNKAEKEEGKGKLNDDRISSGEDDRYTDKDNKEDTVEKCLERPEIEEMSDQTMRQEFKLVSSDKASRLSETVEENDADNLKQMPKEEQSKDNVKQYIQDGVDYEREISQGQEDEDSNIETQIELDATLKMLEQDMTLEDVIKKLEQQSNDLEMKIGPNLTRMLLEEIGENNAKEKEGKGKVNEDIIRSGEDDTYNDKDTEEDTVEKYRFEPGIEEKSDQTMRQDLKFVSSDKASRLSETEKDDEKSIPEEQKQNTTPDHFRVAPKGKSILAPKLMKDQDSSLEDVIQTYENELCVLKNALGPNLVNIILSNDQKDKEIKRLDDQHDSEEELDGLYELGEVKNAKIKQHEDDVQRRTPQDIQGKDEMKYKDADFKDEKEVYNSSLGRDENSMKPIYQKSRDLESIVLPLLDKDEDITLEDIMKNINDDLQAINDKLGPKLSKSLISMESDKKKASTNQHLDVSDKMTEIGVGDNNESQRNKGEREIQEKNEQEEEQEYTDLAALSRMEKESQTLEEVIQQYEDNLNRYEARLGPYLSKAILTAHESHEEKHSLKMDMEQNDSKVSMIEQENPESSIPDVKTVSKTKDDFKAERLEEPLRMIEQGKTLEDILSNYEQERDILKLVQSDEDGSSISISDITAAYNDQIDKLKKDNFEMRSDLDNLSTKIGPDLLSQLRHESNLDTAKHDKRTEKENEISREGDQMSAPGEDRPEKQYTSLEAPIIMAENNQTLEDVIAEYEAQLKEMIESQEQLKSELDILEQSIGPKLFKELCEFKEIDEAFDNIEAETNITEDSDNSIKDETPKKFQGKSDFVALNKMAVEEKPLASILEQYQSECEALERENRSMRKALQNVSGDGGNFDDIISEYENKILLLENSNKAAEKKYEEKHNELQNEIDDLRTTLEKLAQTLRQDFLDDLVNQQEGGKHIEALDIMEKENKTLAEVVEEYEDSIKKLERENAVLQQISGQSEDGTSILDTINDYEDAIQSLKDVNEMLNNRIDALTEKIGPELTEQLMKISEHEKQKSGQIQDEPVEYQMAAVKRMRHDNLTLEEVIKRYEDQIKNLGGFDEQETPGDARKDKEGKVTPEDFKKETTSIDQTKEQEPRKDSKTNVLIHDKGTTSVEENTRDDDNGQYHLHKRIGKTLVDDINDLDNKTIEELEKEDKRPYALRTMKSSNDQLEDILKAYEEMLLQYGLLDIDKEQSESLASELQAVMEGDVVSSAAEINNNDIGRTVQKDNELEKLQQELKEEKELKEKYEKDVEDLLNDIVRLKMKSAGDDEEKEDIERQIKEEYENKQVIKRLEGELAKEQDRNTNLEDQNESLKSEIENMEKEIKALEKIIEEMQSEKGGESLAEMMRKLSIKNKELENEIESLKSMLKEQEDNFKTEKTDLLEQSEKEKKDAIKDLLEEKAGVEIKLQEQLSPYHALEEKKRVETLNKSESNLVNDSNTDDIKTEFNNQIAQLKLKNETLKEQLDLSEASMKEALGKYQEEIKSLEVEMAKIEDEKKHQMQLLENKLELEKAAHERLRNEYDEMLKKEKERLLDDFEKDLERERRRTKKELDEQNEDLERKEKRHNKELEDITKKAEREKEEISDKYQEEKERLQKAFEEKERKKEEEHQKLLNELQEKLEDQMITRQAEMNIQFRHDKTVLQANIEKNIYGEEIQKNLDLESDFQGTLNKVIKDHSTEIEDIEREMRQTEERFKELKLTLLEDFEREKEKFTKENDKINQGMETTIENLLKEVIKLKHQRKEMRQQHRLDKQKIEELFEQERNEIQNRMESSKTELVTKLKEDNEKDISHEREKYEAVIKELQEALDRAETKRKELEEKLRNESFKAEENKLNNEADKERPVEVTKEIKVIKRGIEIEYEHKLTIEKQRFDDTLQGLRREVGNLQEKRKIIQERVYNQENYSAEKHVIEKSIANYKMEVLSKMEGEMTHRLERERKPFEEEVKELQVENEELKRQRWEMKAQFRREKASLEEEHEKEKEMLETNFNKEKEELRKRLEAKLHKEKMSKALEVRINRATSPVHGVSQFYYK